MKIFNIEKAKKGELVCTRCGFEAVFDSVETCQEKPYRFYIYDGNGNYIMSKNYAKDGLFCENSSDSDLDLFMFEGSDLLKSDFPVYFRGDKNRGKEIIAELETMGGKNISGLQGDEPGYVYYINQFGNITVSDINHIDSLNRCTELHLAPRKIKKKGWIVLAIVPPRDTTSSFGPFGSKEEAEKLSKNFAYKTISIVHIDWEEEK